MTMSFVDLAALDRAVVAVDTFPYLIVKNFIREEVLSKIEQDFPKYIIADAFRYLAF